MTDNLRDRFAAVMAAHDVNSDCGCPGPITNWFDHMADAVIRELGLKHYCREWGRLDPTDSGAIYDCLEDALAAIDLPNEKLRTRLITDWVDVQ